MQRLRRYISALALLAVALSLAGCGEKKKPLALSAEPPIAVVWAKAGFVRGRGAGDLYLVHPDSTTAVAIHRWKNDQLDDGPYGASEAFWTPNRDAVAISLAVWVGDPASRVAVVSRDEGSVRSLTRGDDRSLLSLSPDGKKLLCGTFYSGGRDIWSIPIGGGPSRRLPFVARNDRLHQFDWSPDGRRVVARLVDGGLVTMDARGRNLTHLTHGDDSGPHWSPDGRTVLFTRSTYNEETYEGTSNVYLVDADGSEPRALTDDDNSSGLDWSPDGKKILFLRQVIQEKPSREWVELWAMNPAGEQQTRLPFNRTGWSVVSADWGRS
jgi:dipeptidyl aminopeptidase/acylaminoacyl peptidase